MTNPTAHLKANVKTETAFTPGPWSVEDPMGGDAGDDLWIVEAGKPTYDWRTIATVCSDDPDEVVGQPKVTVAERDANARLIAAAPDHVLICWAMCVQDGRWEEWTPFDGRGEFIFAGLRYATRLDDFGCPELTPALRAAIVKARGES